MVREVPNRLVEDNRPDRILFHEQQDEFVEQVVALKRLYAAPCQKLYAVGDTNSLDLHMIPIPMLLWLQTQGQSLPTS